jgi:uncharacterized coiled-coil protein SlyX
MVKDKKTDKQNDENPKLTKGELEELVAEMNGKLMNAQNIINELVGQVNAHKALCAHYEKTMNVLTGRLLGLEQELQQKNEVQ